MDPRLLLSSPGVPGTPLTEAADERRALVDKLAATIQARVLSGELASGTRLRQEALAEEFGVSRTPVREALRKLQASGLVELRPNRGAQVRGLSPREIRDAYESDTDRLAASPFETLGPERTEELRTILRQLAYAIVAAGGVPIERGLGSPWPPRESL